MKFSYTLFCLTRLSVEKIGLKKIRIYTKMQNVHLPFVFIAHLCDITFRQSFGAGFARRLSNVSLSLTCFQFREIKTVAVRTEAAVDRQDG